MNETKKKLSLDQFVTYQIKVPGELGERWTDWYEGIGVTYGMEEGQSITILTFSGDQAALQSLLRRLYSLGLPLLSVKKIEKGNLTEGENTMIHLVPHDRYYCKRAFSLVHSNGSTIMFSRTYANDRTRNRAMRKLASDFGIPIKEADGNLVHYSGKPIK